MGSNLFSLLSSKWSLTDQETRKNRPDTANATANPNINLIFSDSAVVGIVKLTSIGCSNKHDYSLWSWSTIFLRVPAFSLYYNFQSYYSPYKTLHNSSFVTM